MGIRVNPFADGEGRSNTVVPTVIVIFGATGDLTSRKLVPALFELYQDGYLGAEFSVLGVARSELSDSEFRTRLGKGVETFARRGLNKGKWEKFSERIFYQRLDAGKQDYFVALKERLEELQSVGGEPCNYLYYLATSARFFGDIADNLGAVGLVQPEKGGAHRTALVVEKPFGSDLESAQLLNQRLRESFAERQIFRIDHYLGKETVQNILLFRFANGIFEPLWNRRYVESIQISVAESVGVGSRADYFDKSGIVRDILQNHVLQMLALICIEPPNSLRDAESVRDEKVKILKAARCMRYSDGKAAAVLGQYAKGYIEGESVGGYLQAEGVAPNSSTETYAAVRIEVDTWRWAGVPIFLRVGKCLPKRVTEIALTFRRPPEYLFRGTQVRDVEPNILSIQVQPEEGISLRVASKPPGPQLRVMPVEMDFAYGASFGAASPEAYERLLVDAMNFDSALFTRSDEIEECWRIVEPLIGEERGEIEVSSYEAGSWGPREALELVEREGVKWRRL